MAQTSRHLSLLIPGLFASTDAAHVRVTELETLLARSEHRVCTADSDALLFELFDLAPDGVQNPPVAPVTYALDVNTSSGYWLRADPCYMRADSNRVLMMGNAFLNITQYEADTLAHELAPLFRAHDWQFSAPRPKRWYLRLPADPGISWHALSTVCGQDIHHFLPDQTTAGTGAHLWRRILNEAQMILHQSPVNQEREARGELPVNSLWFWGGGALPQISPKRFAQVWSNRALEQGLAKLFATPYAPPPLDGAIWLTQAVAPGEQLVVVEPLSDTIIHCTAPNHTGVGKTPIELLNQDWFAPLLTALKKRELASLHLYTGSGAVFHATPGTVARWWKRPRSFAAYQSRHAQVLK